MPDPKNQENENILYFCSSPYISRWYDLISEYEVQVEWYIVSSIEADSYNKRIAYQLQPVWVPVEWVPGEWYIVSSIETDSYSKGIAYQLQMRPRPPLIKDDYDNALTNMNKIYLLFKNFLPFNLLFKNFSPFN